MLTTSEQSQMISLGESLVVLLRSGSHVLGTLHLLGEKHCLSMSCASLGNTGSRQTTHFDSDQLQTAATCIERLHKSLQNILWSHLYVGDLGYEGGRQLQLGYQWDVLHSLVDPVSEP